MRFASVADTIIRGGHLSDRAIVDAGMTGERPAHMDRCDICAERALEFSRWMDDVRGLAEADIDAVFPAERLAAQQSQIMRRLEQIDQPARVIAFPKHIKLESAHGTGRGIAPGWLAVAAAAGLLLGVAGTQVTSHFSNTPAATTVAEKTATPALQQINDEQLERVKEVDQETSGRVHFSGIESLDQATPTALPETQAAQQGAIILASQHIK